MDIRYDKYKKIANDINDRSGFKADIALILGSGLGGMVDEMEVETVIQYNEIEGFPVPTVEGHAGRMIFGRLCEKNVVAFQGRKHYYECKDMEEATIIVRIIKAMGIDKLILTNAAGGIGPDIEEGNIMMLRDHISSFVPSPLLGKNIDEFGVRFPDMTNVYDKQTAECIMGKAKEKGIDLKSGVYVQTTGPNYETPAEIKMFSLLGANAVGMSTACEAMVARHMNMTVCGFSCITNMAAGLGNKELSHEEVGQVANRAADTFKKVVKIAVETI